MRLQCVKRKFLRLIEFAQHLIINATKNIKLVTIQHIQGIMRANLFKQISIYSETSKPNPFRTKTFVWNRQVFDLDRLNSQIFLNIRTKSNVSAYTGFWFIQGSVYTGFWLIQGSVYSRFSLHRILVNSGFSLHRILVYSGFWFI